MPSFAQALPPDDISLYRVIANFWQIELSSNLPAAALMELSEAVCDTALLEDLIGKLPGLAQEAMTDLFRHNGSRTWAQFTRKYGELREVGAGKRDREKLYDAPISATEILWYRGLIGKAFFNSANGMQEQVYIPDEIAEAMELIGYERAPLEEESLQVAEDETKPDTLQYQEQLPGRMASELESAWPIVPKTDILDDATTVLSAMRAAEEVPPVSMPMPELVAVLQLVGALRNGQVEPESARALLEASRADALRLLRTEWQKSATFNELAYVPTLDLDDGWTAPVLATREFLFQQLRMVPKGKWWNINSFIRYIKDSSPDFQRPSGNYDTWMIRQKGTQTYLSGFSSWDDVEGELIRAFITGPFHWLRYADLASSEKNGQPISFRIFPGLPPMPPEDARLVLASNGRVTIPINAPRSVRYQIARFCSFDRQLEGQYQYQVTTASLAKAKQQGLRVDNLISLLAKHSGQAVPPVLTKALKRWDAAGSEARFMNATILRFSSPKTLQEFKASRAARTIMQELNPTTVMVPAEAIDLIRKALMEMGILSEVE